MNKRVFAWVAVGLMAAVASANADPIKISGGQVSGAQLSDGAVRAYKGIPFAKPPIGDLRWREPQPAEPWSGTLAAETHRPVCMQPDPLGGNSIFTRLFFTPFEPRSEDCLYLNVWTTAAPGDKRPVMVWIPGGGFRGGSSAGAIYDGAELAKKGVVLVSINYRLWKFGFLATSELSKESPHHVSGNYGLLDQIAALRWVKDNVAAFGGDPGNVTIFGQSAGASSANFLMASPVAKGLFQKVIGESGGTFLPAATSSPIGRPMLGLAAAEAVGSKLATDLKATSLADLRKRSGDEILASPSDDVYQSALPIMDGYVLPATVAEIFTAGKQNDVPLLAGTNANEGANFPTLKTLAAFREDAKKRMGSFADEYLSLYAADTDAQATEASAAAIRDTRIAWPNLRWATTQLKTGHSKVFYYYFPHHPPAPPNEQFVENLGKNLGASHGAELAYVFGNFIPSEWAWADADKTLAKTVSQYWVNFATNGDPNGPGLPAWPTFNPDTNSVLRFDATIAAGPLPNQKLYAFWDKVAAAWKDH